MRSTLRRRATVTAMLVATGALASCTDSESDEVRASDTELDQIATEIQAATGPAAVVSATTEDLGLVVIAINGPGPDPDDVVEDTCQVILDNLDGPAFSFLALYEDGTPRWWGSTDSLERCPPR